MSLESIAPAGSLPANRPTAVSLPPAADVSRSSTAPSTALAPPQMAPTLAQIAENDRWLADQQRTEKQLAQKRRRRQNKGGRPPKLPKDSKINRSVLMIQAYRAQGYSTAQIAEEMGLSETTIPSYIRYAKQKGWLTASSFTNPDDQLEHVIKPAVLDNVEMLLTAVDPETGLPNQEMTIETAKGLGIFKNHSIAKGGPVTPGTGTPLVALRVQIVMPSGVDSATRTGVVGGVPSVGVIDAETVEPV